MVINKPHLALILIIVKFTPGGQLGVAKLVFPLLFIAISQHNMHNLKQGFCSANLRSQKVKTTKQLKYVVIAELQLCQLYISENNLFVQNAGCTETNCFCFRGERSVLHLTGGWAACDRCAPDELHSLHPSCNINIQRAFRFPHTFFISLYINICSRNPSLRLKETQTLTRLNLLIYCKFNH